MTNLTIFAFERNTVRFVGTAQKPEWVAQDVCSVLGIKNARDTLADFELDEKGVAIVYTPGGEQVLLTITEPGLYRLIFKSRKEIAKRFQRWVFHEVLPSIRKTGSYSLPPAEAELKQLELQLILAKQRYQDTGHAIALSTSPAMLRWLRGEAPPPAEVEYLDRFIDSRSGKEVGSSLGRSLSQLITDAGLNPKSQRDRELVKRVLKRQGFDYDSRQRWSEASYLRKYPVLSDSVYEQALKAVLNEVVAADESEQNLFVHQMQQATLNPKKQSQTLPGVEL